jgi:hypothetical protein
MTPLLEALILIALGLVSLLLGKRLFWLFAGIVGFALGWWLMGLLLHDSLLRLLAGVVVGLILAGLSRFLGKWAIRIVVAVAGFVLLPMVLGNMGMLGGVSEWLWAIVGAIFGLLCAVFLADWALIVVSSILGASLLVNGAQIVFGVWSEAVRTIVGVILTAVGIIVQARQRQ